MTQPCTDIDDLARRHVAGDLPAATAAALCEHAGACAACARVIARERVLAAALAALPAAPASTLDAPRLPMVRPVRRRWLTTGRVAAVVAVAAAAGLLLALRLGIGDPAPIDGDAEVAVELGRPVRVRHVFDAPGFAPLPDDGLLAIAAGVEAVVMRRPTEVRSGPSGRQVPPR